MISKEFEVQYKRLNAKQREAVDAIEGPVMVIAGPGTGKTTILTLRIANILKKTDTTPDSILALTFTESGVHSMRQKLVETIGVAAYRVNIHTFHSFCNELIQTYPEEFPRIIGSLPAGVLDQIRILEEILEKETFELLKPHGNIFYYVRPLLSAISDIKRENVSVEKFKELIADAERRFKELPDKFHEKGAHKGKMKGEFEKIQRRNEKNRELLHVYDLYEKALRKRKLYDYDDMIVETVATLEKRPEFLLILQEEYQYILADEHQDANNAQNRLLELLSGFHENPNLFIVGDEKQAIYRFQGASLDNFLFFKKKFTEARVISLDQNYRSTQHILDASHSVIEHNTTTPDFQPVKLVSGRGSGVPHINLAELETPESESAYIAACVKESISKGVLPHEIALIYRDNNDAHDLGLALSAENVPYVVLSDQDAFSDAYIRRFLWLLRSVENPNDSELLSNVLHFDFLELPHLEVWKVIRFAHTHKEALINVISSKSLLEEAGIAEGMAHWKAFSKNFLSWGKSARNESALSVIELIADESGFIPFALSGTDSISRLEKYDAVLSEIRRLQENHKNYALRDFILFLETLERHEMRIGSKQKPRFTSAVQLLTAHRSKGLEFEEVFISGARDKHWGNKRSRDLFTLPIYGEHFLELEEIEDERRLFYVALTRAKRDVLITYSKTGKDGKETLPSVFVEEIDKNFLNVVETDGFEKKAKPRERVSIDAKKRTPELQNSEYLRSVFLEEGISVTALNNYLTCPWKYFFTNLIRIPQTPEGHQLYGNAVHAALKDLFDSQKDEHPYTENDFVHSFERSLMRQPISEYEFRDLLKRGTEALKGYYAEYHDLFFKDVITEFNVAGIFVEILPGIKLLLKGRLDKVELLDGTGRVNVVDYKTGKPKSKNDILGETKNSEGNIKRQLDFYKLLLDSYEQGPATEQGIAKYEMVSGEIDFVEPNTTGKYRKEKFEITKNDVEKVREEVVRVGKEIYTLEFWEKTCDDKNCEFCKLGELIRKKPPQK